MRIVGIILVILSLPAFIALLWHYPRERKWACLALGAAPFAITMVNLDAAFVSWPTWQGVSKGMVVGLADTLAIAIIVTSRQPFRRLPLLPVVAFYLLAVAVSLAVSAMPMASSFYLFQQVRLLLMFVAVASFAGNLTALRWLAFGLALGAIAEGLVAINQSIGGAGRAVGTMGHQNLLGLVLHFVTIPLLAFLLAGERNKLIMGGALAGVVAVALGASRGSMLFAGIGIATLLLLSLARRATPQKWKIVGLGVLGAAIAVPLALGSLTDRFGDDQFYKGPDTERLAFEEAAKAIWSDHPMGVGANQYVFVANTQGYSDAAGVSWVWTSRSAHVHNMYLLAAAETGWLGLIGLIALFAWPIWKGISFAFANRKGPRGEIVLGASVALFATAMHGFYEWVFFQVNAQYVFAIALGIIAGTLRAHAMEGRKRVQVRQARVQPIT